MAALFAFTGSQIMSNLLSVKSMRVEVCLCDSRWSLTIEYVVSRAWYIGCALGFQPREEISIISVRSKCPAGVAYWLGIGSPVRSTEFDSPHSLHAGVAQVEEHRTRNAEVGVSNIPSGSSRCSSVGEQSHGKRPMSVRFAPLAPES